MKHPEIGSDVTDGVLDQHGTLDPAVVMWGEAYASQGGAA